MASLIGRIRDALRDSGGMTTAQLADALGEERKRARDTCSEAKGRGVLIAHAEDGRLVFALNPDGATPQPSTNPNQNAEGSTATAPDAEANKSKTRGPWSKFGSLNGVPKAKESKPTEAPRKRDFFAAAESADKTLKALLFSRQTAADALQVYVHLCVDPEIYNALQNAVHGTQAAIDKFSAGGEA